MTFRSSRTLPGQGWRWSWSMVVFPMTSMRLPNCPANSSTNDQTSSGMSSRRSRRRRHLDRKHVQPVVEVLPELAFPDQLFQVPIRRRDDADIDLDRLLAPQPLDLLLLQDAQQLGLDLGRQLADFIQEDAWSRWPVRSGRPAGSRPRCRRPSRVRTARSRSASPESRRSSPSPWPARSGG